MKVRNVQMKMLFTTFSSVRRLSRSGLVDALTAHYGLPGRLADYRRQFERTTRTVGEDPAIFATALETLAVKAFGDMGQTARLRLIRDRFIAGHSSCSCVGTWTVCPPRLQSGTWWTVAAFGEIDPTGGFTSSVTNYRGISGPTPEVPALEKLLQRLVTETQSRPPPVVSPPAPTELEQMMCSFLAGQRQRQRPPQ